MKRPGLGLWRKGSVRDGTTATAIYTWQDSRTVSFNLD